MSEWTKELSGALCQSLQWTVTFVTTYLRQLLCAQGISQKLGGNSPLA